MSTNNQNLYEVLKKSINKYSKLLKTFFKCMLKTKVTDFLTKLCNNNNNNNNRIY